MFGKPAVTSAPDIKEPSGTPQKYSNLTDHIPTSADAFDNHWTFQNGAAPLLTHGSEETDLIDAYCNAFFAIDAITTWLKLQTATSALAQNTIKKSKELMATALTKVTEFKSIAADCLDVSPEVIRSHSNYLIRYSADILSLHANKAEWHKQIIGNLGFTTFIHELLILLGPSKGEATHTITAEKAEIEKLHKDIILFYSTNALDHKSVFGAQFHQYSHTIIEDAKRKLPYDTYKAPDDIPAEYIAKPILDEFVKFHSMPIASMIACFESDATWLTKIKLRIDYVNTRRKAHAMHLPADLIQDIADSEQLKNQLMQNVTALSINQQMILAILAPEKGIPLLKSAAAEGNTLCIPLIMELDEKLDPAEAKKYFDTLLVASKQVNADATIFYCIGMCLLKKYRCAGIPEDKLAALEYFQKGAAKNHANSIFRAGWIYTRAPNTLAGETIEDHKKAATCFEQAAKQGHPEAIGDLGYTLLLVSSGQDQDNHAMSAEYYRFCLENSIQAVECHDLFHTMYANGKRDTFKDSINKRVLYQMALLLEFNERQKPVINRFGPIQKKLITDTLNSLIVKKDKEMNKVIYLYIDDYPRIASLLSPSTLHFIEACKTSSPIANRETPDSKNSLADEKLEMSLTHNWIARLLLREKYNKKNNDTSTAAQFNDAKVSVPVLFQPATNTHADTAATGIVATISTATPLLSSTLTPATQASPG